MIKKHFNNACHLLKIHCNVYDIFIYILYVVIYKKYIAIN